MFNVLVGIFVIVAAIAIGVIVFMLKELWNMNRDKRQAKRFMKTAVATGPWIRNDKGEFVKLADLN